MVLNLSVSHNNQIFKQISVDTSKIKINTKISQRGKNNLKINEYEIEITDDVKDLCWDFCSRIIMGDHQYNRLDPSWTSNKELSNLIRIQRSYAGKIGEVSFLILLASKGITTDYNDMFRIYYGQTETDLYDFRTKDGQTIDVKTAYRPNHKCLVVNSEQLSKIPKYYYIGILLNAQDSDTNNKIIDDKSITKAKICGYADLNYLKQQEEKYLTEALCKAVFLDSLMGIDRLIEKMD